MRAVTHNRHTPWPRAVAVATIVGGIAGVLAVIIAIVALPASSDGAANTSPSPNSSSRLSGTPSTADNAPPGDPHPTDTYLADIDPANYLSNFVERRSADIDGTTYPKSIVTQCGDPGVDNPATYALGKKYRTLTAVVGVEQQWSFNFTSAVSIIADGKTIKTLTVGISEAKTLSVDVTGVNHLELHCDYGKEKGGKTGQSFVNVAFGDAKLSGS